MSRKRVLWGALLVLAGAASPLACSGGDVWQGGGRNYTVDLGTDSGTASQPDSGGADSGSGFDAPIDTGSGFDAVSDVQPGN